MNNAARKEEEQRVQRAAEREGRRMRRRRGNLFETCNDLLYKLMTQFSHSDRERKDTPNDHLDGMSSDDEIPEHENTLYKNQLSKYYHKEEFFVRIELE